MYFQVKAYYQDKNYPEKIEGNLTVLSREIQFYTQESELFSCSFSQLSIKSGGTDGKILFFESQDSEGEEVLIQTRDWNVIKKSPLQSHPDAAAVLGHSQYQRLKTAFFCILLFIFVMNIPYIWRPALGMLTTMLPVSLELKLGEAMLPAMESDSDPKVNQWLNQMASPLGNELEKSGYKLSLVYSDDPEINARTLPGGIVLVNRGLIEHAKDADCILGVIAHEAGHVKYRHCIQSMVQSLGITLVFYLVFDFTGGLLTLQGITKSLLELQYSREMESEADLSALKLLQNSGIREDGMVRFLKSMKEDLPNLPKELEFFSSHPHSESRIDLISKGLPKTLSHTPEEAETLFKKIKSYLDAKE